MLGASFDSVEANRAFAAKESFNFPLLCDTGRVLGMAYGACDSPTAWMADRISYLIDSEGRIERVWDKVKPSTHPAEVMQTL